MGHGTYHHHLPKHYHRLLPLRATTIYHQYLLNYLLLPLYPTTNTYYYNTYHDHRQLLLPPAQLTTNTSIYHYLLSLPRLTPTANKHQEYQHQYLLLPVTTTYDHHLLPSYYHHHLPPQVLLVGVSIDIVRMWLWWQPDKCWW